MSGKSSTRTSLFFTPKMWKKKLEYFLKPSLREATSPKEQPSLVVSLYMTLATWFATSTLSKFRPPYIVDKIFLCVYYTIWSTSPPKFLPLSDFWPDFFKTALKLVNKCPEIAKNLFHTEYFGYRTISDKSKPRMLNLGPYTIQYSHLYISELIFYVVTICRFVSLFT